MHLSLKYILDIVCSNINGSLKLCLQALFTSLERKEEEGFRQKKRASRRTEHIRREGLWRLNFLRNTKHF